MFTFISRRKASYNEYGLSLFGTACFNIVWEKVCAFVLDNQLDKKLSSLNVNLQKEFAIKYGANILLKQLIEKPLWIPQNKTIEHKAMRTLMPDIVSIYKKDTKKYFIIFDAKYYTIKLNETKVENYPGVEDVVKQYLYNLAYKDFIETHNFNITRNAFIFSSEDEQIELLGTAKMELLEDIGLDSILVVKMPAHKIFRMYIDSKKLDIGNQIPFF